MIYFMRIEAMHYTYCYRNSYIVIDASIIVYGITQLFGICLFAQNQFAWQLPNSVCLTEKCTEIDGLNKLHCTDVSWSLESFFLLQC